LLGRSWIATCVERVFGRWAVIGRNKKPAHGARAIVDADGFLARSGSAGAAGLPACDEAFEIGAINAAIAEAIAAVDIRRRIAGTPRIEEGADVVAGDAAILVKIGAPALAFAIAAGGGVVRGIKMKPELKRADLGRGDSGFGPSTENGVEVACALGSDRNAIRAGRDLVGGQPVNLHFTLGRGRGPLDFNAVLIRFDEVVEDSPTEEANEFEFERGVGVVGAG